MQRWFFERELAQARTTGTSRCCCEVRRALEPAVLEQALGEVLGHHDALRMRFRRTEQGWVQENAGVESRVPLTTVELCAVAEGDRRAALERAATQAQGSLRLERGPVQAVRFAGGRGRGERLLLAVHHLVVDAVSWRVLLEDLETACAALERGAAPSLPAKTTSFRAWAARLGEVAGSAGLLEELPYWREVLAGGSVALPVDHPGGGNRVGSTVVVAVSLTAEETQGLLKEVPGAYRTQVNDALLAALARALCAWTGGGAVRVELEGHGREEEVGGVDVSRTVGWFTTLFPVRLEAHPGEGVEETLGRVKEELRAVPRRGLGYGLLRHLGPEGARRGAGGAPVAGGGLQLPGAGGRELRRRGGLFELAGESAGDQRNPAGERPHVLEVGAVVAGGRLQVSWKYGRELSPEGDGGAPSGGVHAGAAGAGGAVPERGGGGVDGVGLPAVGAGRGGSGAAAGEGAGGGGRVPADAACRRGCSSTRWTKRTRAPTWGRAASRSSARWRWRRSAVRGEACWSGTRRCGRGFAWEGLERPLQVVRRGVEPPLSVLDWRGLSAVGREERLEAYLREDRVRGFDLARAPLMRLSLVRMADEEHELVWTHHHLVQDGWSLGLIFRDAVALYDAHRRGERPMVREGKPFRDYVAWLERRDRGAAERFWRDALAGFEAPTRLGVERTVDAAESVRPRAGRPPDGSRRDGAAPGAGAPRGRDGRHGGAGGVGAPPLALLGGEDVVFGSVVSGRPAELEGVEEMVGLFINTLPVRARARPEEVVLSWLRAFQARQVQAREHEHAPLARVQRWSDVPAGEPLFDTLLVFENYPFENALAGRGDRDLRVLPRGASERTHYPLALGITPGPELLVRADYDSGRFDAEAVERLLRHFVRLLGQAVGEPSQRVGALELIDAAEREQVLARWNATSRPRPAGPVHRLVSAQAARTPGAPAVLSDGESLTYAELEARSDRLAALLHGRGVGPEARVGVLLDRTPELLVALLAVWKAGGAYVPLDPSYPAERLRFQVEDAGVCLVVARPRLSAMLPAAVEVLPADAEPPASAPLPVGESDPRSLAYVIYTSGSTGVPKGVAVEHASLANLAVEAAERFGFRAGDVVPSLASNAFDIWLFEVLAPLLRGGAVRMMTGVRETDRGALLAALRDATAVHAVPALMEQVVAALREAGPRRRAPERVFVGGDRVPPRLLAEMRDLLPGAEVHVLYGPTEGTVLASSFSVPREGAPGGHGIGSPLGNVRTYVLGRGMEPSPVGVGGELYVGGAGVARGYQGRPELTAERFVPDAFSGEPGGRLYRTGDRVRWLAGGTLEFLGRVDHQVKVRGFRIEPGEVEAALRGHPGVAEAAVVAREDVPGQRRLVGYVVAVEDVAGSGVTPGALREWLRERLPEHLVPSAFVLLEALPLTPNGKLDRRALPAPERGEGGRVAPRTEAERALAQVWAEVLRVERVGVEENFFELGGDSILSIQVVSRARRRGLHLSPRQLFEHPTVAALARVAGSGGVVEAEQGIVTGAVELTPVQRWFFERELAQGHHWNQSMLLRVRRALEPAVLERALGEVLGHHDALRMRFRRTDQGWVQENAGVESRVPLTTVELCAVAEGNHRAVLERAATQAQGSLRLERGPVRAVRFAGGRGGGERLLLVVHHLVVDAVSWRVLLEDLEAACAALERGAAPSLPAKTTSFRAWAARLGEVAGSAGLLEELPYWREVLAGGSVALPVDHPGGGNRVGSTAVVAVSLTAEETQGLLKEVPGAYRTQVNDALLAALARALCAWMGGGAVRVELEGHGREEEVGGVDVSRTVGWFTTLYPVRLEAHPGEGVEETLGRVKEELRAVPRRGLGYGLLRHLGPEGARAELAAHPSPEVGFNYLGQVDGSFAAAGGLFELGGESAGEQQNPAGERPHVLEVGAVVAGGRLQVSWKYGRELYRRETVERLAEGFTRELRELVGRCRSGGVVGWTGSDFPLSGLDAAGLERLLGRERGVEDVYPLTPMQEGMLFHSLDEADPGAYLGQFRFTLVGPLEVEAFRRAWQGVVDRHPVLRTGFAWEGLERPLQMVRPEAGVSVSAEDWREAPPAEREGRLEAYLREDRVRGFDLARAPLMRLALFRTGEEEWELVWTQHHLVMDGWSMSLVFRDVVALYDTHHRDGDPALPRSAGTESTWPGSGGGTAPRPSGSGAGSWPASARPPGWSSAARVYPGTGPGRNGGRDGSAR